MSRVPPSQKLAVPSASRCRQNRAVRSIRSSSRADASSSQSSISASGPGARESTAAVPSERRSAISAVASTPHIMSTAKSGGRTNNQARLTADQALNSAGASVAKPRWSSSVVRGVALSPTT